MKCKTCGYEPRCLACAGPFGEKFCKYDLSDVTEKRFWEVIKQLHRKVSESNLGFIRKHGFLPL